jgi:hypothetical protein
VLIAKRLGAGSAVENRNPALPRSTPPQPSPKTEGTFPQLTTVLGRVGVGSETVLNLRENRLRLHQGADVLAAQQSPPLTALDPPAEAVARKTIQTHPAARIQPPTTSVGQ